MDAKNGLTLSVELKLCCCVSIRSVIGEYKYAKACVIDHLDRNGGSLDCLSGAPSTALNNWANLLDLFLWLGVCMEISQASGKCSIFV
jgi:hypothetical protein